VEPCTAPSTGGSGVHTASGGAVDTGPRTLDFRSCAGQSHFFYVPSARCLLSAPGDSGSILEMPLGEALLPPSCWSQVGTRPLQSCLRSQGIGLPLNPLSLRPEQPPAACDTCARTCPLLPSDLRFLRLCGFPSRCLCVRVSVSLCMWLVETQGVHAGLGTSEVACGQIADPRPFSPVLGAGVLRSEEAVF
jgi:hypothetical protein